MQYIAWSPENEVFIALIDAEHRNLFRVAEGLVFAIEENVPEAELVEHLHSFAAHLEDHLSHEEWLMQSVHYPSYGWHRQQHDTARRRLTLFVPPIEAGNEEAADAFLEFVGGWLNDHTSVSDRMMAAFVRNYERAHATSALERWGTPAKQNGVARRPTATPETGPFSKTVRYCPICSHQTTHELRPGGLLCRECVERSIGTELDRD